MSKAPTAEDIFLNKLIKWTVRILIAIVAIVAVYYVGGMLWRMIF